MSQSERQGIWAVYRPILSRYVGPQKGLIALGVLAGIIAAISSGFGLPVMIQYVFPVVFGETAPPAWLDQWITRSVAPESREVAVLWVAAVLVPVVMMVRGASTYLNSYLLTVVGIRLLTRMRIDLFSRLQWLSFSFHDRVKRGDLMTIVMQFTQALQMGMVMVINDLVVQILTLLAAVAYLVYAALNSHESAMLLVNLLISAACIPLVRYVGKSMLKHMRSSLAGMVRITSTVEETLSAQREVRAFNLEEHQTRTLREVIRFYNDRLLKMAVWRQFLTPAIEIVSALALAYSLYRGCSDGLTLEQFAAIATAFYFCYDPLKKLAAIANQCEMMVVNIEGINRILDAQDETPEPKAPQHLPQPCMGTVDFDHVSFGYEEGKPVLHDITVHVPAGQVVALVGPSGSGKTTFINLICRFYDVNAGRVLLDGVDVRQLTREERTGTIGLVSQFSALFCDTIRENIRVGRPGADDDMVRAAGDAARVSEFAAERPEGYDRMLAEGGTGLSGGQRQRVSIARAFLKNAPVLILDEATSALDMKSEALIQEALEELARGHTTFIIAHRFSTIRMAQRILVFEKGRIVADGSHAELYQGCVLYRHLYDEQVRQAQEESVEQSISTTLNQEVAPC